MGPELRRWCCLLSCTVNAALDGSATVSKPVILSNVGAEITEPAPLRSVQAVDEETMRVGYHDK